MNRFLLTILLVFSLRLAYATQPFSIETQTYSVFENNFDIINAEIYKTRELRDLALAYYKELKGKVLGSDELEQIHLTSTEYKKSLDIINPFLDQYIWTSDSSIEFKLTDKKTFIEKPFDELRDHLPRSKKYTHKRKLYLNPNDEKGISLIMNMKLGLASALVLYDNFTTAFKKYQDNKELRRLINTDNSEVRGILAHVSGAYSGVINVLRLKRILERMELILKWENAHPQSKLSQDGYNLYLNELIQQSEAFKGLNHLGLPRIFWDWIVNLINRLRDDVFVVKEEAANIVSSGFGNTVGMIQSPRSGQLINISKEKIKELESSLKPLDILFEKTSYRLTDKLIPGHWGHVAIWVGNEVELKDLGVWEQLDEITSYIRRYHNYRGPSIKTLIRSNHLVLEALRPGVMLNTFQHFLDIDDLAVVRTRVELSREQQKEYLIKAFKQIGKSYDFNFNVQTDKKIVCSELAYVVYDDYEWPVDSQLGRYTISPDNVAVKAKENGEFYPVLVYHKGKEIIDDLQQNFDRLIEGRYNELSYFRPFENR